MSKINNLTECLAIAKMEKFLMKQDQLQKTPGNYAGDHEKSYILVELTGTG